MDFLRQQLVIIQERLRGLTPSQKLLAGALVVIMMMTMLYWGRFASWGSTPETSSSMISTPPQMASGGPPSSRASLERDAEPLNRGDLGCDSCPTPAPRASLQPIGIAQKSLSALGSLAVRGRFNSSLAHFKNVALTMVNSQSRCRSRTLAHHMHDIFSCPLRPRSYHARTAA